MPAPLLKIQHEAASLTPNRKAFVVIERAWLEAVSQALELRGYAQSVTCESYRRFSDTNRRHIEVVLT